MTHTKRKVSHLSHARLVETIMFLLAWLKVQYPEAYSAAESEAGFTKKARNVKVRMHKEKRHGNKRGNPAGLIKAIQHNRRMSPAAKRKAIAKLRKRVK